jgi:hypothetical protein
VIVQVSTTTVFVQVHLQEADLSEAFLLIASFEVVLESYEYFQDYQPQLFST